MYKANTEKLTARYAELVQQKAVIKTACGAESKQIAAERGYDSGLTDKLANFLYIEKYKNEKLDNEIAYLGNYVENVESVDEVEGAEIGEVTNQNEA